jgi:5-methylcytosine-specific restriction protein B
MKLHEKLVEKIRKLYDELDNEGEILTKLQLDAYCQLFRDNFGPDVLGRIDGEVLLNKIHNMGDSDSLVYWMEYKNDEEFPTMKFGSIGGGSNLKYGIFKRKETGIWTTGSPRYQQELSMEEAVEIARKHRDQLLEGIRVLERFPEKSDDEAYSELQKNINSGAPDVGNTAWGHKYFFMLNPYKLDDYHSPEYQRFHLIKLLQVPPNEEGRYICAGRYVSLASQLEMMISNFTRVLNSLNQRPHRYWRIGTRLGGTKSIWDMMKSEQCVAVGWEELGNLSDIKYSKEDKEKVRAMILDKYEDSPQVAGRSTQQIFNFVAAINEGDYVIPCDGEKILGTGKIVGEYYYASGSAAPHRRHVEWLSWKEWKMPEREGLRTTVNPLRKARNLVGIEEKLLDPFIPKVGKPKELMKFEGILGRIQQILERKKQVILYGPPGTGKTYWAEKAACNLASNTKFGKKYDDLDQNEKSTIKGESGMQGQVRICTFHPVYGYEDFMEGYRPLSQEGQLIFKRQDGIFKQLCKDAEKNPSQNYYLIIDEINRGDIPRIFGELMTIIEKDKRSKQIILPVSGESFSVPENLYIIGTMNTADRSIALLDTALRRRFGFIELMPDIVILKDASVESIVLGPWLEVLNSKICQNIGRDARNLQIGHAYFLENGRPINNFGKLRQIIRDDILPLIQEYCYEDYQTLEKILGSVFVDARNQRIKMEIFEESRQDDLLQAIRSIDPSFDSSKEAIQRESERPEEDQLEDEGEDIASESE